MTIISEVGEKDKTVSDGEFPQMWEHYGQMIALRQRMLQAIMAYYLSSDVCVEKLYETEVGMGLPHLDYVPQTQAGQNALTKFNSLVATYKKVLDRFKSSYSLP